MLIIKLLKIHHWISGFSAHSKHRPGRGLQTSRPSEPGVGPGPGEVRRYLGVAANPLRVLWQVPGHFCPYGYPNWPPGPCLPLQVRLCTTVTVLRCELGVYADPSL